MQPAWLRAFDRPGNEFRGAPFWSWNSRLAPEELRRQIHELRRMGFGGFFMHSRVGLDTPYLGEDWMKCVAACIEEARQQGMYAWLYDEDRWPSGFAGGLVTRDERYRQRGLVMQEVTDVRAWRPSTAPLALYAGRVDGHKVTGLRKLPTRGQPQLERGETLLAFSVELDPQISWFNGQTYVDTLNPAAIKRFLEVTHAAYQRRFGADFGQLVPGIFTDEPAFNQLCVQRRPGCFVNAWTDRLPQVFRQRYGYDVRAHLPELFLDVDGQTITPARYHYHDCITHLFTTSFAQQIGEWCGKHNLALTGHVMSEDSLRRQVPWVGSCMRFYEHMQAPGMDLLTERSRIYDTAKQVSSAARQFGRKWRLTETYGCTGWDFPLLGHKALSDWQVALGINFRCPHLSWYTMEGEAKRDYPAGIFYQSPWWTLYPKVEDYFARIHAVMTRGVEVRDVLVIHPNESMWTVFRKNYSEVPDAAALDRGFAEVRDALLTRQIDFDYGDEELLSRHGRVQRTDNGPILRLARAPYRAVVVPPTLTLRGTTLALLRRFHEAGGLVVFAGERATHVDAKPSEAVAALARRCPRVSPRGDRLAQVVGPVGRRVSVTDDRGNAVRPALYLLREDRDAFYLFICNTGHTPAQLKPDIDHDVLARDRKAAFPHVIVRLQADARGTPVELDPDTGTRYGAAARRTPDGWELHTSLPALGSRLFVFAKRGGGRAPAPRPQWRDVRRRSLGGRRFDVTLSEPNVLVLDRPRYRIAGEPWRGPEEILRVDTAVRKSLGIAPRGGEMVQPWARERRPNPRRTTVTLAYAFDVQVPPTGPLHLGLERPGTFQVAVNGTPVPAETETGWWCDRSLRLLPVDPALLHAGRNEVVLTCDYAEDHSGLEIVYLLGSFGTTVRGTDLALTAAPTSLRLGDWVPQGLAFYSGAVSYRSKLRVKPQRGERVFVRVPAYRGAAVRVLVNGQVAGVLAWDPHEVDVTSLLGDAPAELAVEVISHRRNSHGAHHYFEKWPVWTGPGRFVATGKEWIDGYQLVPCGLMAPPELVFRRS